jgi:hypothetical protein
MAIGSPPGVCKPASGVSSRRAKRLFDVAGRDTVPPQRDIHHRLRDDMARKPISVWIGQILIAVVGVAFAGFLVYFSILQWSVIIRAAAKTPTILVMAGFELVAKLAAIAFVAWTVALISRRSPLGRWFGLLCLALLLAGLVYQNLYPSPSSYRLPYDNDAQRLGASVGQFAMLAAYVTLMVRFGFSKASKLYFAGVNAERPSFKAGEK